MMKKTTLKLLFVAFIFASLHTYIHNSFDHMHNSECSVYVLEQLYFSADVIEIVFLFTVFIPFLFLVFQAPQYQILIQNHFQIRAPPLLNPSIK